MVKAKYQNVLDLGAELNIANGDVKEENGILHITGTADTQFHKDQLWDAIKATGGESPADIMANINVANTSYYAKHTVQGGESLSLIAKKYYKDPMKYKAIFEANTNILKNPDIIQPGQELTIPNA